jgi:hypothetical protein
MFQMELEVRNLRKIGCGRVNVAYGTNGRFCLCEIALTGLLAVSLTPPFTFALLRIG